MNKAQFKKKSWEDGIYKNGVANLEIGANLEATTVYLKNGPPVSRLFNG